VNRPLNLARQPFTNDRLPTLVLGLGCVLLLGLSVRHGMAAWQLLPSKTAAVDGELVALEQEARDLREKALDLRERSAPEDSLREWAAVRALVDRRAFSWSKLLACLEETMPPSVRLRQVTPGGDSGPVEVRLTAVARTVEDGLAFLAALRARPEFADAFLGSLSESQNGIELQYTMRYAPRAPATPSAEARGAGEGAAAPGAAP